MAATLMPFRGPEQELFAHLRSFESYQSSKTTPTSSQDIPRSKNLNRQQQLTSDLQDFISDGEIDTMSNRWTSEYPSPGSRPRPRSSSPCNRIYTETPACTIEDLRRILARQKNVVMQDMPGTTTSGKSGSEEKPDNKPGKRPSLGRKYSSLIDTDAPGRPHTRKRADPGTRIRARSSESATSLHSSIPTTSTASNSRSTSASNSFESSTRTTTSRPLQPILKPSDSRPQRPRHKPRVSFSTEDQVVTFEQQDETPIKDARSLWRVDSLPRRTDWEEQMATLSLNQSSARKYHRSQDKYPGRARHSPNTALGKGKETDKEISSRATGLILDGGLRGSKSPTSRPETSKYVPPWEKPLRDLHKHRHVDPNCGHEITDPMPCSCEDPDKIYEGRFSDCRQCRRRRLAKEREERTKREKDSTGWWSKLTGKG
ncbi:hypothetical protein TWF506_006087 [Arthrobotrys conoides]|uniref:Uncharacterized protein n=1 Tax=Arthrobotrys conoides TaxID=74498 RepID=A0AAN8N8D1_9PEZI